MIEVRRRVHLPVPASEAWAWHARDGGFERLVPPWERVEVTRRTGGIEDGSEWHLRVRRGGLWVRWLARHEACEPGCGFTDVQVRGPFAAWRHDHRFLPAADDTCELDDHVQLRLPLGRLGRWVAGGWMRRTLSTAFRWRQERTRDDLQRHADAGLAPQRIAVTGASGLLGRQLVAFLRAGGHTVLRLVRRAPTAPDEVGWSPSGGSIDLEALRGTQAIIHLAGENVGQRWTAAAQARMVASRVTGTRLVAEAAARLDPHPVLISASGVSFYGHVPEGTVTEDSPLGAGFLAELARDWEAATAPAEEAGVRVVRARIGVVLTARGGALTRMLPPYRFGLGAAPGGGHAGLSWVGLDDVIAALHFCLADAELRGPINVCAPAPTTHLELAKTLGRVLRRPVFVPLPAFVVKLLFGRMGAEVLLEGQRALPGVLAARGFRFQHSALEGLLRSELGRFQS